MTFREFLRGRRKRAVLLLLAGFFSGGILYYLCQGPAETALASMEESAFLWAEQDEQFWSAFLFVLWERGKTFGVLWIAGFTPMYRFFIRAFIVYAGIQCGFLFAFFLVGHGLRGLLLWAVNGIPHLILLVPLYLYSFFYLYEKRRGGKRVPAVILIVIVFLAAVFLEARVNVPLMRWAYQGM